MVCIEVSLDGQVFRTAGSKDASLISPTLSGFVGGDTPARLTLSGMHDLPDERAAHVYWGPDEVELKTGAVVTFRFTTSESPSDPEQVVPTDSPEYIEEQREFEALKKTFVPDTTPSLRRFPDLAFHCRVNRKAVTVARLNTGEEHVVCSVLWNKWHPNRFRVSLRSFGNEPNGQTEWLRDDLAVGDELEIRVAA
jgi:hypothetical protein